MPSYSPSSKEKFDTLCPELKDTMSTVLERYDHTIFCGHRGEAAQNEATANGTSTKKWPDGKHNRLPSDAVDAGPVYRGAPKGGIDWRTDKELMISAQNGDWEVFKAILENIKRW